MSAARRKPSSTVTQEEIHALQNPEAERAVLGEMLESPEALSHAQGLLTSGHFFSPANRTIFETALSLHAKGIPADAVILKDKLSRRGELDAVGGPAYIGTLTDAPCGHAGLAHYADILLKLTQRRGLLGSAL